MARQHTRGAQSFAARYGRSVWRPSWRRGRVRWAQPSQRWRYCSGLAPPSVPLRSPSGVAPIAAPPSLQPPHLPPYSPRSLSGAPLVYGGSPAPEPPRLATLATPRPLATNSRRDCRLSVFRWSGALILRDDWREFLRRSRQSSRRRALAVSRFERSRWSRSKRETAPPQHARPLSLWSLQARSSLRRKSGIAKGFCLFFALRGAAGAFSGLPPSKCPCVLPSGVKVCAAQQLTTLSNPYEHGHRVLLPYCWFFAYSQDGWWQLPSCVVAFVFIPAIPQTLTVATKFLWQPMAMFVGVSRFVRAGAASHLHTLGKSGIAYRLLLFYRLAGRACGLQRKNRYRPTGFCSFIALRVVPAGFLGKSTGRRVVTISDNTPSLYTASKPYYVIHPLTLKYLFPCTVIAGGTPCVVPLSSNPTPPKINTKTIGIIINTPHTFRYLS